MGRPRSVLVVSQVSRPGGAEVILMRTMGRLVRRGWKVVLTTPRPGPTRELARRAGIPVSRVPVPVGRLRRGSALAPLSCVAVALLARVHHASAVYLDGRVTQRLAPALALARLPGVIHIHDLLRPGDESRLWRRPRVWRRVRAVLVDSEAVGRALTALGVQAGLIRNVRVAVELDPAPVAAVPEWADGEAEIVGYVGRVEPRKGTIDLLQAAPAIIARRPRARIVVVGEDDFGVDPEYERAVRAAACRAELDGRVVFAGAHPDAHALMRYFDVLAFPSREEPGGTAAAEALAAGVPVVAADTGGMSEVVIEGETGSLVPAGDPAALAEAVVGILERPDREAMSRRARAHAELFSVERSADVVEAALREAAGA